MSRDEQERLRDIKDAIVAIRQHVRQAGETAAALEDPLLHDARVLEIVERDLPPLAQTIDHMLSEPD